MPGSWKKNVPGTPEAKREQMRQLKPTPNGRRGTLARSGIRWHVKRPWSRPQPNPRFLPRDTHPVTKADGHVTIATSAARPLDRPARDEPGGAWLTGLPREVISVRVRGQPIAGYVTAAHVSVNTPMPFGVVRLEGQHHAVPHGFSGSMLNQIVKTLSQPGPQKSPDVIALRQMSDKVQINCIGALTLYGGNELYTVGDVRTAEPSAKPQRLASQ